MLSTVLDEAQPAKACRDAALAAAVAVGDVAALGELYDLHHAAVRAFARRLIDKSSAEDLLHDTFLTLPRALARWNGEGTLRTFIMGVAVNHAQHRVRSRSRLRAAIARFGREPERVEHNPEEQSGRKQLAATLQRALATLSFDHRTVFVLCAVEQRTSVEVAEILAVPEGTVRTRLHYAKQKLRAAYLVEVSEDVRQPARANLGPHPSRCDREGPRPSFIRQVIERRVEIVDRSFECARDLPLEQVDTVDRERRHDTREAFVRPGSNAHRAVAVAEPLLRLRLERDCDVRHLVR